MFIGDKSNIVTESTQETTLIRTVILASGTDDFMNIPASTSDDSAGRASIIYSRRGEVPTQIAISNKCVQFLSEIGHVYYSGSGGAYGISTDTAVNEWLRIILPDDVECISIALSTDGTYAAFIDCNRKLHTSGISIKGIR